MTQCFLLHGTQLDLDWLKGQMKDGDVLLTLSLQMLSLCSSHFDNVLAIEDFVAYSDIVDLATCENEINKAFGELACEGETLDGYNWPDIFWHWHQFFFRDILLAESLATALKASMFDKFIWIGASEAQPVLYTPTIGMVRVILNYHLGSRFETLSPPNRQSRRVALKLYTDKIKTSWQYLNKSVFYRNPSVSHSKVVAVLSINEWARYTDALINLAETFDEGFHIWILGARYPLDLKNWISSAKIKSFTIAYPDKSDKDISEFFERHWKNWQQKNRQLLSSSFQSQVLNTDILNFQLKYYYTKLWPRMVQWARKLEENLQLAKPDWVVGSSRYGAEIALPFYVATKLGVASVALPDSSAQYGDGTIPSSFLACRTPFEREHFRKSFADDTHVLYCVNAGNKLSYAPQSSQLGNSSQECQIAILTADPDYPGTIMSSVNRKVFLDELSTLFKPPAELKGVKFVIKSHPRADITPLLHAPLVPESSQVSAIAASASVIELIQDSWVVILFNHYGSVLVQAILAEKPIIFIESAKFYWPHTEQIGHAAGTVVENMESFWSLILCLQQDPATYQQLTEKVRNYKAAYLPPATQTLAQILQETQVPLRV